jgi:hypothetical protein
LVQRSSARAKGEVLDAAIADEIAAGHVAPSYRHVIAYAAEELDRVEKDNSYTTNARTPWHPLVEMGQDRAWCDQYLYDIFGFHWPRRRPPASTAGDGRVAANGGSSVDS